MPLKIVRNDITKMCCDAIVNTANEKPKYSTGCDTAIYEAAGAEDLLKVRKEIGVVPEGKAFITPAFRLHARYIIHAVSPRYIDGNHGEEGKLRSCYRGALSLAKEHGVKSIAFPLISTGGFGYPKEEGLRIALDEIEGFLMWNPECREMLIYLVVFDEKATTLSARLYPDLESYIDENYVEEKRSYEYADYNMAPLPKASAPKYGRHMDERISSAPRSGRPGIFGRKKKKADIIPDVMDLESPKEAFSSEPDWSDDDFYKKFQKKMEERLKHQSDTFSEYLLYLIESKGMKNADVYKRAIVDKKVFSKIKNNPDYQPTKKTALCLCVGAKLNLDETRDLLARAGLALSPCKKEDIIFSYFIENHIYDMIELDIQLEEHGLPCMIS